MRLFIPLAALLLAACAPSVAPVATAASSAPATAAPAAAPTATPTPIWKDQVFVTYKAKLDAAAANDPRQVVRLFLAAFAHYNEDRALALDMMAAAASDANVHPDANCRSGKLFNRSLDPLWVAMDGHPTSVFAYFDAPANALAPDADAHVRLDDAATVLEATSAVVYVEGGAARPAVHLIKQANGWRIADFSALVITP